MNWTKVKVILITLFVIINALLITVLISKNYQSTPPSDTMAKDIAEILCKRNISVPGNLITTQTRLAESADAYPISSESSNFIKNLRVKAQASHDGIYILDNSEITVYDNFVHFDITDSFVINEHDFFKTVGIDFSSAKLVSESGDGSIKIYTETYDNHEIFGANTKIVFSDGVIKSADVTWYEITEKHTSLSKTISFAESLLEFASDKSRGNQPCTVSDITFGYSIDAGSAYASVSQMIPCIRITTDIGSSYFYDARSPE